MTQITKADIENGLKNLKKEYNTLLETPRLGKDCSWDTYLSINSERSKKKSTKWEQIEDIVREYFDEEENGEFEISKSPGIEDPKPKPRPGSTSKSKSKSGIEK